MAVTVATGFAQKHWGGRSISAAYFPNRVNSSKERGNVSSISDQAWLNANLDPASWRQKLGIQIPNLPAAEIQTRFTGRQGRANLEQAFDFYSFVLQHMPQDLGGRFRILDFGGGWGRILRFFLREIPAERLVLCDCLTDAVECGRSLAPPFAIVQNATVPPLPLDKACADCCYAFSVFSHLHEPSCRAWLSHLSEMLLPGGKMIFTTRGPAHIRTLRHLRLESGGGAFVRRLLRWVRKTPRSPLTTMLPHPDEIERQYSAGNFVFYSTGGGGELTSDFYGEAWITERWMNENYRALGYRSCEFYKEFATIDQCVFVLTK